MLKTRHIAALGKAMTSYGMCILQCRLYHCTSQLASHSGQKKQCCQQPTADATMHLGQVTASVLQAMLTSTCLSRGEMS